MDPSGRKPVPYLRRLSLPLAILLGILVASLVWLLIPLDGGCTRRPYSSNLLTLKSLWSGGKPGACVAHALGEIDGVFYTDSRDAFVLNYDRGFRTFEVDLVLLRDGSSFCAHDGSEWMYGLDKPFTETTSAELSGRLCLGKYTPLTGCDLLDLMNEYTDACFLLDAKRTTQNSNHAILEALVAEARSRHPSVLDRMIPHTFGPADLWEVAEIHPFRNYWAAVYGFRCDVDGDSGAEPDRIVVYVITHGGPLSLLQTADILSDSDQPFGGRVAVLLGFRWPAVSLFTTLYHTGVYISVDIMEADAVPPPL